MLRRCLLRRCMPIGVACRTLGFQTPPTNNRDLKKRFIQLTKEHHPDLHADDAEAATERMVRLTQAYTCLKKLLEHGVHYQRNAGAGAGPQQKSGERSSSRAEEVEWAEAAASFRAPGSSISLRGFTLPWQRATTTTATASMESMMSEPNVSFHDFVRFARQLEHDRQRREERRRSDAATADGTHGFTAEYFESTERSRTACRGPKVGPASTHVVRLWAFYYGRRLRAFAVAAPRNAWHTIRYILLGH
ncbi:putative mitochondrial chaperone protein DNAj [Leptomonas pyrrhocoris]|uniref:Putative mitochondrial chaperone protein DNAj n=1 Tax=Leptomonas pyrrhocoris TaxID=157538 RepID=A0A0M9FTZ4_LEPPY|nr:putative mitochondrial chaperone protein DNAj [Leptomonas pyrrhocoris]KPA76050.1 putative mitochondrial chaperone protein DNAj [Leptomonas pyrrhocoris]|eukprot:XP_015654489.1 putative mitochondrial chaperone protein DNAj [Leptomonas pyrrhocoris]